MFQNQSVVIFLINAVKINLRIKKNLKMEITHQLLLVKVTIKGNSACHLEHYQLQFSICIKLQQISHKYVTTVICKA